MACQGPLGVMVPALDFNIPPPTFRKERMKKMAAPLFEIQPQKQVNVEISKGLLSRKIIVSKSPLMFFFAIALYVMKSRFKNIRVSYVPFSFNADH